jgi:hypothetical protein
MSGAGARRGRRAWVVALALLLSALAAAALATHHRLALVERLILWQLGRLGMGDASLAVTRVGLRELVLRDLRIGDGDLALDALELHFSPAGLQARRLDAVRIGELRLRGRIDATGLGLGALDALRGNAAGARDGGLPALPVLPVGRLEVDRATLLLDTPHGAFEATLSLELDEGGRGRFRGTTGALATFSTPIGVAAAPFALVGDVAFGSDRFEALLEPAAFSLTLATGSGPQPITGSTPRLSLRGGPGLPALEIDGADGELSLLGPGIAAKGVGFALRIDPRTRLPDGGFEVSRVSDRRKPARFAPVALEGRLTPGAGRLGIDGVIRAEAAGAMARFEGAHDLEAGGGRLGVRVEPLRFGEKGPRLRDLLPGWTSAVRPVAGAVDARGELLWGARGPEGFAELGLRDLTLEAHGARIEGVNAAVRIEGPWPLHTPRGQLLSMARVDLGLELRNGLVRFALRRDGAIEVEQAEWTFAGGRLRSAGRIEPDAERQELVMTLADLELGELLALVNLDGLDGSGRLEGRLPLSLDAGGLRIADAEIRASDAGGTIRYRPSGRANAALGGAGAALDDFLLALHDFRYERLSLHVNGDPLGEVSVGISLAGANPAHREGQPYVFNLNLEGRLGDLVRKGSAAYRIPGEIQKRLEAISRGAAVDAAAPSR